MQQTLGNNRTKVRSKIFSKFWEIAVYVGGRCFSSRTLYFGRLYEYMLRCCHCSGIREKICSYSNETFRI